MIIKNTNENIQNKNSSATNEISDENKKVVYEVKKDALGRSYATGKRKNSIARVWIKAVVVKLLLTIKISSSILFVLL